MASRVACFAFILAVLLLGAACDSTDEPPVNPTSDADETASATPVPARQPGDTPESTPTLQDGAFPGEDMTIRTANGAAVVLYAEIAETSQQRAQGLMGRTELAPDSGMLFVLDPPPRGFWMKDTPLPLTVAFISACGEIVDFADLEPLSEEIRNTERPYIFALEMERGWFQANTVTTGDVLQLPARLLPEEC